jgi:hypothetical protein
VGHDKLMKGAVRLHLDHINGVHPSILADLRYSTIRSVLSESDLVVAPIIELGRPSALMRGHLPRVLDFRWFKGLRVTCAFYSARIVAASR